jgi:hypothetical protein
VGKRYGDLKSSGCKETRSCFWCWCQLKEEEGVLKKKEQLKVEEVKHRVLATGNVTTVLQSVFTQGRSSRNDGPV